MITSFKNEYRWLSNFYPCVVNYNGLTFQSVENAYQSAKSEDLDWKLYCSKASAKESGTVKIKSQSVELVQNWKLFNIEVMMTLLVLKFSQEEFKTKLLNTGMLKIIEGNDWGDNFWGVDTKSMKGRNILGSLIMTIRQYLKQGIPFENVKYPNITMFPMVNYCNGFNTECKDF